MLKLVNQISYALHISKYEQKRYEEHRQALKTRLYQSV